MSEERILDQITAGLHSITRDWPIYNTRRLDYRRGSLPTNSMPEHVAGSAEPAIPERDALEQRVTEDWTHIKAGLMRIRTEVRGIEARMAFLVYATKRPDDPTPQACANAGCPDARIYSMIGKDHPRRSDGRCEACHKWHQRKGYERGFKHYELGETQSVHS